MSRLPLAALAAAGGLSLAACGSSTTSGASAGTGATTPPPTSSTSMSSSSSGAGLTTASSDLGTIVVDGGRTVYVYDADTQGATRSACTGGCLSQWPPVEGSPKGQGVTGTVGTITAPDGGKQLTLDGWPLYYFAGDSSAGDTTGQAVGGVWWVVAPDGSKITGDQGASSNGTSDTSGYAYRAVPRELARHREPGDDRGHHGHRHDDRRRHHGRHHH